MNSPATDVVRLLTVNESTLAVAESLTGGLVAAEITSVPGASKVFRGSVTAYATDLKHGLLAVDADLLAARGAVDAQVAAQMAMRRAEGAGRRLGHRDHGCGRPRPTGRTAGGDGFRGGGRPVPGGLRFHAAAEKWRPCG